MTHVLITTARFDIDDITSRSDVKTIDQLEALLSDIGKHPSCLTVLAPDSDYRFLDGAVVDAIRERMVNGYPLYWTHLDEDDEGADTPLGRYRISPSYGKWFLFFKDDLIDNNYLLEHHAKEAAQEHYARVQAQEDLKTLIGGMI